MEGTIVVKFARDDEHAAVESVVCTSPNESQPHAALAMHQAAENIPVRGGQNLPERQSIDPDLALIFYTEKSIDCMIKLLEGAKRLLAAQLQSEEESEDD